MTLFKKNKRCQAESQFHWVFVLIAGAAILSFFVTFVYKHKAITEKKEELKFTQYLELQISLAEVTSNSLNNRSNIPFTDIKFSCKDVKLSSEVPFNKKIVFAPSVIKTNRLYIYTYNFLASFKVTNFVYIIPNNQRFIFIVDNPYDNKAYNEFESALDIAKDSILKSRFDYYEDISVDEIKRYSYSNIKSLRFVFIDQDPTNYLDIIEKDFKHKDTSILYISHNNELTFYTKDKKKSFIELGKTYYFDKSSLLAAIITNEKETYDCGIAKAFERLNYVSEIHIKKIAKLKQSSRPDCYEYYDESTNFITKLKELSKQLSTTDKFIQNVEHEINNFKTYTNKINEINTFIKQNKDCPTIY